MSYINATLWNDLQVTNATNEKRFSELGIIDAVKASTMAVDYVSPSAQQHLREASSLRDVQIPVIKDQTVTVNTTPGFTFIPSNLPETAQYAFTAYDVFSGFRHYPAAHANNTVDSDFQRNAVMNNVAYAMGNTIEGILATNLSSRKSQLLNNTVQHSPTAGDYSFNAGTDQLEIKRAAQKDTTWYNLQALMESNELPGSYRIVTNRGGTAIQKIEMLKYGAGNDKDLRNLGFFDASRMHESGNLSAGSDIFNGYLIRDGAIGMYENFPFDFRNGTEVGGKKWTVSDVELPYMKMRANIYTNAEATDADALITSGSDSNMIMTHFEEMAVWARFYVVYRYNSDLTTRVNDIVSVLGTTA